MSESINKCLLCGNEQLNPQSEIRDFFGDQEVFQLISCNQCNTLYTSPRPDEKSIITYYKSNSYISHGDKINPIFDNIYKSIQQLNFKYKHNILKKYTLTRNHLDFGCGSGSFLQYLKDKSWNVTGIEPDQQARQQNQKLVIQASLDNISPKDQFSSITLFHVLEHIHQLETTLKSLVNHLDKNGVLVLALPNFLSLDAKHYQEYWAGYDVPRHLYHFSQKSIHQLAKTFGLNIVATHPMKFDSYYVSLLSEQYKTGKKNYIRAFLNGYRSNRKAKKSGEYSSLIYVLSK